MLNNQGRPTRPNTSEQDNSATNTFTGNKALELETPLIFEQGVPGRLGVDMTEPKKVSSRLGNTARSKPIGLPDLSEPQVLRHFVRLSRQNYSIDSGFYPLGSCTMKHNPRINEKVARLAGLGDLHPMQPVSTVQGALELIDDLAHWLKTITGMPAVAMSPAAGAHGELCGVMAIRAAHEAKGEARKRILVPESAHGTNPATAALCGYKVESVPAREDGRMDLEAFSEKLGPDVAGVMLTNPNTCGLFENDVKKIADMVHEVGAYFYCDGANLNAILGRVRPGDLGVDAMHINLHKTFSTPHGGGGPGSGPVVLSEALAAFAPIPFVTHGENGFDLVEHVEGEASNSFGRMKAYHGQMGMFIRALAYMQSHGADGLRQIAEDAVLNANYIRVGLNDMLHSPFDGICMHEALFDDSSLKDTGVTTLDLAKAMIDEGYHPMTMYFPLVVHGAMLIEPTESESRETLDQFIGAMRYLLNKARDGEATYFAQAPHFAPRRRLDETGAARNPILRWTPEEDDPQSDRTLSAAS
ncbi:aminomethyl-transferring glycine dehydrogenase subunit GcvPB [Sneathiella marina]|uniref:glycine dehydrogenase (aminomethyl-transferring) n=2 Tax=Sneathiella marina TaxID=2950108 RepID=A0ABY4W7T3_9PROT|nr:aminomethyl-transferring glycine dehydrogenase subunit GcvPB [Sneathiella marina]USG62183.1 aminomethyl-transferring glycine dehydrogenase subunit GcvPB [Sneathiella marina]